ncbi:MAG: hypothetical protein V9G29_02205 [Burkholderiaceae bacterium]
MASETVLDYLGNPCQIAEAKERFEGPLNKARALDVRDLAGSISGLLNKLIDREEQIYSAISTAHKLLESEPESDHVRALLAIAMPYQCESCCTLDRLAGQVLAALELGKLVEAPHG